jgi:hypothetical protein
MRPIALDTNTYVGFKRGDAACLELLAGFACGDREARNREELRRFLAVAAVEVVPIGLEHGAMLFSAGGGRAGCISGHGSEGADRGAQPAKRHPHQLDVVLTKHHDAQGSFKGDAWPCAPLSPWMMIWPKL